MLDSKIEKQEATIIPVKSITAKQDVTIARLEAVVTRQQQEIRNLTSQIHEVNEQLEASKITSQLIANDP